MSTLIRLARSRDQLPFFESPRVALKVFGARLALFGMCVVVVGGAVIAAGALPPATAVFVLIGLLGQAVAIWRLLVEVQRDRALLSMVLASQTVAQDGQIEKASRQFFEYLVVHRRVKMAAELEIQPIRQQLRVHLNEFDKHELELLASSLLAESNDRVEVDDDSS
jgi:hypothetical protein